MPDTSPDNLRNASTAFDIDWKDPNYSKVFEFRTEAVARLRKNPQSITKLKEYYKSNWANFIMDWSIPMTLEMLNKNMLLLFVS